MSIPPASLRRRAACAVLAPLLSEEALDEALQLQQRTLRGDGVAEIIAFIDAVAARNLLDAATRKRLYPAYFEALKRPEAELPFDPWPTAQPPAAVVPSLVRGAPPVPPVAPPAAMTSAAPVVAMVPVATPVAAPVPAPAAEAPAPVPEAPAEQQVFAALIAALQEGVKQNHARDWDEFRQRALALLPQLRSTPAVREVARLAWGSSEPSAARWLIAAPEATLAELVNLTYVALCEALGPIDADRLLTEAVREAQRLPAARRFSPRRLV